MEMPGGKHQGKEMHEIPSDYLKWVSENWSQENVAEAADEEWNFRERNRTHFYD